MIPIFKEPVTWNLPWWRVVRKPTFATRWMRADVVSCTGGHGNTEKKNLSQTGVREGFCREGVSGLFVCICPLSASLSIYASMLPSIPHLSNAPVSIYLASISKPSAYLFASWRICLLSNCWSIGQLSVCLSVHWLVSPLVYLSKSPLFICQFASWFV